MPLKFLSSGPKWPKSYGFEIYGSGPTYVVSVQPGSTASQAGLSPGDQLLEVDGQDVTTMAASAVKTLAKHSRLQPPALEVVACVSRLLLEPQGFSGYGFAVLNDRPVVVGSVEFGGPAFEAGLRVGDVILEVNGQRAEKVETVGSALSRRVGQLSLLTIPVGRSGQLVHVDKGLSHLPASDPRVHRAKDLYDKLGEVLGEDYERKMTVVAILKQYAEDRDIDILCRSLDALLHTPRSRAILRHIRTLVTPSQRPLFDHLLMLRGGPGGWEEMGKSPAHSYTPSLGRSTPALRPPPSLSAQGSIPSTHTVGTKKLIQIIRENGSFGFVVKGCSPAHIESVDPQGPADTAGLAAGDFITRINGLDVRRCDHDRLIDLLQDSGSTPTLEILRCQAGQHPVLSPAGSLTSLNTCSSQSSHGSDLMPFEQHHVDSKGKTFTQHAEFLLTPKERLMLKRVLQQYELNRDVVGLYGSLESVLDTPSKQTLWKFILVTLQAPHREYVLHRVGLPPHLLTELLDQSSPGNMAMFFPRSTTGDDGEATISRQTTSQASSSSAAAAAAAAAAPSFQHHIDFLLTSTERQQFKAGIQLYQHSQDLQPLVEVMGLILDTPSKRVLWRYVLPHLTPAHQGVVRHMMDIPDTTSVSGLSLSAMESYIGSYEEQSQHVDTATNTEDEVLYGAENNKTTKEDSSSSDDENDSSIGSDSVSQRKPVKLKQAASSRSRDDQTLLQELAATRRAVEEVKEAIRGKTEEPSNEEEEEEGGGPDLDAKHFVTIIPVGYPGFDVNRRPFYSKEMDSPEFQKLRKFVSNKQRGGDTDTAKSAFQGLRFRDAGNDSSDSDSELVFALQSSSYPGGEALNHKALVALKELDEVMAAEASSDPDSPRHGAAALPDSTHLRKAGPSVSFAVPPPPPPPPPPPLPPLSTNNGEMASGQEWGLQMNVKRINWEKLDNKRVENTIWEQMKSSLRMSPVVMLVLQLCDRDLSEVIRYLELESQFSTKPSKTKRPEDGSGDKDKKREVCIMNSKKAYNISILLGHLKLGVGEIKQAVYLMDEETLTPELLPQLITYAPSKQEMTHYDAYTGEIDDLSKPDQFSYEMSQIYGYEQRLKALLFKASFSEKTEEMKENLRCIRMASNELRHSKKLAKLLELILAMGNYMNKGNTRVGEAAGFRITFLTQLDITKTADSQSTFLHVLADTCYTKFPELLPLPDDLPTLSDASKVSSSVLNQEIQDLRKGLQDISTALDKIGSHGHTLSAPTDHFQDVMGHFISEASDEIQSLLRLQASVMEEFGAMVCFFGEDPHLVCTEDIFNIFFDFVAKFERAHRYNMMYKRR